MGRMVTLQSQSLLDLAYARANSSKVIPAPAANAQGPNRQCREQVTCVAGGRVPANKLRSFVSAREDVNGGDDRKDTISGPW